MAPRSGMARERNRTVWDDLYRSGTGVMEYPSEHLVRMVRRTLDPQSHPRILDLGFGSGNNLKFLARAGFDCHGVEVSEVALSVARKRLDAQGLRGELRLSEDGLPYEDGFFDGVICWLTLYYHDEEGVKGTVDEMHRVLREGGRILTTLARPDDVLAMAAEPMGGRTFRVTSRVPSQEGAVIFVPEDEDAVRHLFGAFRNVEIGHFEWSYGDARSAHWIITAE